MPPMAIVAATAPGSKQVQAEKSAASISIEAEHPLFSCTQSQLCLALTILKSKPADTNARGMLKYPLDTR
jgi:hypothetical protein